MGPKVSDNLYGILIIQSWGSRKTNALSILKNYRYEIYLHAKVSYEPKYQLLIKKTEVIGQKQVKNISKIQKLSPNIQMI